MINGIGISYIGIPPLIMTLAMASVVEAVVNTSIRALE